MPRSRTISSQEERAGPHGTSIIRVAHSSSHHSKRDPSRKWVDRFLWAPLRSSVPGITSNKPSNVLDLRDVSSQSIVRAMGISPRRARI